MGHSSRGNACPTAIRGALPLSTRLGLTRRSFLHVSKTGGKCVWVSIRWDGDMSNKPAFLQRVWLVLKTVCPEHAQHVVKCTRVEYWSLSKIATDLSWRYPCHFKCADTMSTCCQLESLLMPHLFLVRLCRYHVVPRGWWCLH